MNVNNGFGNIGWNMGCGCWDGCVNMVWKWDGMALMKKIFIHAFISKTQPKSTETEQNDKI